jgi:hypothetical protein
VTYPLVHLNDGHVKQRANVSDFRRFLVVPVAQVEENGLRMTEIENMFRSTYFHGVNQAKGRTKMDVLVASTCCGRPRGKRLLRVP